MHPRFAVAVVGIGLVACGRQDLDSAAVGDDAGSGATTGIGGSTGADTATSADASMKKPCTWTGFTTKATYPTGSDLDGIAIADFDGDGRRDLAISNWGGAKGSFDGSVSVFLANGAGIFAAQSKVPTDLQPMALGAGDLNGDGRPDLVAVNNLGALDVLFNSAGRFKPLVVTKTTVSATALALADFDGDGRLDVVVAGDLLTVAFGKGDGTFGASVSYMTGSMPMAMKVADVDGDGHPDLVVTNVTFPPGAGLPVTLGAGSVNVFRNLGAGTFAPQVTYPAGNGTSNVAVGDLDGDGRPELLATNTVDGTLGVFVNTGNGTFGPQRTYADGSPRNGVDVGGALAVADFNGDGKLDVVSTSWDATAVAGNLVVFLNSGKGDLAPARPVLGPLEPGALATEDFDADGLPDLAVASARGTISILLDDCR